MMTIKMMARLWISSNDDNDIEVTIRKIVMIATMIIIKIMENDYYSNKNKRVILLMKKIWRIWSWV